MTLNGNPAWFLDAFRQAAGRKWDGEYPTVEQPPGLPATFEADDEEG